MENIYLEALQKMNNTQIEFLLRKFNLSETQLYNADENLAFSIFDAIQDYQAGLPEKDEKYTDEDEMMHSIFSVFFKTICKYLPKNRVA